MLAIDCLSFFRHKLLECKHPIHIICRLQMPSNYMQTITRHYMPSNYKQTITTHFCTFFCYLSVIHNFIKQSVVITISYQDIIIVIIHRTVMFPTRFTFCTFREWKSQMNRPVVTSRDNAISSVHSQDMCLDVIAMFCLPFGEC